MTRFLLVRHGQSEWNAQGRWQGLSDPPLSDRGRDEARMAAASLDGFDGVVVASPLLRAKQTADVIAGELLVADVSVEADMREIDVGEFAGLTNDEIQERFPLEWTALSSGRLDRFPGGEARDAFALRVNGALEALASRHPGADVLVVTHGGAIATLERQLDVHPGIGVGNLEGRWFELEGVLRVGSGRVSLVDQAAQSS